MSVALQIGAPCHSGRIAMAWCASLPVLRRRWQRAGQNLPVRSVDSAGPWRRETKIVQEFGPVARSGPAHDYRLLVEAIESGDLVAARQAYGRMMERLSGIGVGADDALAAIGASLRSGDLTAAHRTVAELESRALSVLRGLRELAELTRTSTTTPTGLRRLN
jgi:hypothetical protein